MINKVFSVCHFIFSSFIHFLWFILGQNKVIGPKKNCGVFGSEFSPKWAQKDEKNEEF